MTTIRPYAAADLPRLTAVHNQIDPERPFTPAEMAAFLADAHCWLALDGREHSGLRGRHARARPARRQRPARRRFARSPAARDWGPAAPGGIGGLTAVGLSRTSGVVDELDSPLAQFLLAHGFSQDHEEVTLVWTPPPAFAPPRWPDGFALNRYPLAAAMTHFRSLYEAAFNPPLVSAL
jgi:hypothetical protein